MTNGLTSAIDFSLDVQQVMSSQEFRDLVAKEGVKIALGIAINNVLAKYPGAVISDDIKFPDGSWTVLTDKGFEFGED